MKRLTKIKSLLSAGFLFLLMDPITVASDLIEPTRTLSSPAENTVELSVFSEPAGLDVDLDGVSIGKTPVVGLKVEPGSHVIRLQDVETEINAEPGKSIKLSWFKGAFIHIPVEVQKARVQHVPRGAEENAASKIKISEQSDGEKEILQPLYWPLNPSGPIW
jgi:hypothetical protein